MILFNSLREASSWFLSLFQILPQPFVALLGLCFVSFLTLVVVRFVFK